MGTIEKTIGFMFVLILVYLLITDSSGVSRILSELSGATNTTIRSLQGRA
jgi:hypothetical protein